MTRLSIIPIIDPSYLSFLFELDMQMGEAPQSPEGTRKA
jgi:hypothetical protein